MTQSLEQRTGHEWDRGRHDQIARRLEGLAIAAGAKPQRPNKMSEVHQAFGLPTEYTHDDGTPLVARVYVGRDIQTERTAPPQRSLLGRLADTAMGKSPTDTIRERLGYPNQMGVHLSIAGTESDDNTHGIVVAEYDWTVNYMHSGESMVDQIEEVTEHIAQPTQEVA
jgi:hypothetical protein